MAAEEKGSYWGVPGEGPQAIPSTEEAPAGATFTQRPGLSLVLIPGWNTGHCAHRSRGPAVASATTDAASFLSCVLFSFLNKLGAPGVGMTSPQSFCFPNSFIEVSFTHHKIHLF